MTYQQMVKLQIEYRRPERELIRYVARGTTLVERESQSSLLCSTESDVNGIHHSSTHSVRHSIMAAGVAATPLRRRHDYIFRPRRQARKRIRKQETFKIVLYL